MGKISIIIGSVLASLLLLILGLFTYMGAFSAMRVKEAKFGPYSFFYKPFTGPYEKVAPLFQEVHDILKQEGIEIESMAGIYYDDPEKLEKSKLRSEIGAVLSKKNFQRYRSKLLRRGLQLRILPRQNYVSTEFPYRNIISVYLGVSKAYPAIKKYTSEKRYPEYRYKKEGYKDSFAMEMYTKNKILYLFKGI